MLSIVSPVYQAENIIPQLIDRIEGNVSKITDDYEIILVEDGSSDNSWEIIQEIAGRNSRVKGLKLSRNFGQHNAITAGLDQVNGEWIIVMDCDLQDRPEEIERLYNKAQEGYEIVLARRVNRQDSLFKRMSSKIFYKFFGYLTETKQDALVANFGIYSSRVILSINSMGDYFRVFPILVQWVGFSRSYLDVEHSDRMEGKSSYRLRSLVRLAIDMVISFSEKPMRLGLKFGIVVSLGSIVLSIFYLILYLMGKILVPGYTSMMILISFSTGLVITFLGMIGLYIGKISVQVKNRPTYIISDRVNG
ncbi:glycosyltransferase family 2 protein [Reichenbachiella sp. MALMAid0571]|uniref:glycosyltransferase family 2 protein n=1 Tax=Reichenbachiella sp. MALMAid0571 TaxID=3143939 RepID=UPI0032DFCB80